MHLICSDEKIMCPINMHLICSDDTVYGGPLWNKERSDSSYHWLEPAYLCNKSGGIGLLLFCDAPKLQKTTNPKHFFPKVIPPFQFLSLSVPHSTHFHPPKRQPRRLGQPLDVDPKLLLPEVGSHDSCLWWSNLPAKMRSWAAMWPNACGGSASQPWYAPVSPRGPALVVAPPPSQDGLPCHHVAPHPRWLYILAETDSCDTTWLHACGGSTSQVRWAPMLPHVPRIRGGSA
jgi:hypothetical protein